MNRTGNTDIGMTPVFYMFTDRQKAYDVIEAVDGKKYVAGQIKNTNVVFSDANGKNKNVILSAETGNCDPIGIDPPPYGNGP